MKEGWKYRKLEEICSKGSSNISLNKIEDNNGEYNLYGASGLVKGIDFYHQEQQYIGIVKDGSGVGRVNIYPPKSSLVGTMQYIFPNEGCEIGFLKYLLQGLHLEKYKTGAAIPHIYFKDYCKSIVPFPPLSEQQHIVEELDLLSSIIEKKKAQLNELDNLAQSLFYEMFGDPITNDKGWETKTLGDISNYSKTRITAKELTVKNYVGVENLLQKCEGKVDAAKVPDGIGLTEYLKDDVLIGNIRPYLRKIWLAAYRGGCNGDVLVIRRLPLYLNAVNPIYLFKCLSDNAFFDFDMQYSKGEKMPRGDKKEILKYPICIPPIDLQNQFASKIEAVEHQKELIKQSIKEVETLFNSRMDYYFN